MAHAKPSRFARAQTGTEWLQRFSRRLRVLNVEVDLGSPDAVDILRRQNAEAVTIRDESGATLLFRDTQPTLSAVLEEVTHVLQATERRFEHPHDEWVTICRREIEVRECLIQHRERLGIPEGEDDVSRKQMEIYQADLDRRLAEWA